MEQQTKLEEHLLSGGRESEKWSSYQYLGRTGSVIPTASLAGTEVSVDEIRSATTVSDLYPPSLHAPLISSPEPYSNEQAITYPGVDGGGFETTNEAHRRHSSMVVKPVCPSRCVKEEQVDCVEEDNLANAKLLNLKSKSNRFGKGRVVDDDEPGLRTFSRGSSVASDGTPRKLECIMKPMCRSFFDKYMQSISFTERPIEPAEDAGVSQANYPLVNIVKTEEECREYNTTQVPELELEAQIRKLEIIVDGIKAQKFASSSRVKLGKCI